MYNLIMISLLFILTLSIFAQQQSGDLIMIGPGLLYSKPIYAHHKEKFIPVPAVSVKYKKFNLNGLTAIYNFKNFRNFNISAGLSFKPSSFNPEESYEFEGIKKKKDEINFFTKISTRKGKNEYGIDFLYDLNKSNQIAISLYFSRLLNLNFINMALGLKFDWESQEKTNYRYGVFKYEENAYIKSYLPQDAIFPSININVTKRYNENLFFLNLNLKHIPSRIRKSPLIDKKITFTIISGFAFKI